MTKWNEPKPDPPPWLSKHDEVQGPEPPKVSVNAFIVACMEVCLRLGCNVQQAGGVTANARAESANGQSYKRWNLYGWKMTKEYALFYRKAYGKGPPYWAAPGNKAPGATLKDLKGGDPPWCYYRVFESFEGSLRAWMEHYVPRPNDLAPYPKYRECGTLFWSDRDWFAELIRKGYKGDRTRLDAQARAECIADFRSSVQSSITRWAQARLGVDPDGKWGDKSKAACRTFQGRHDLQATGNLDPVTLGLLASKTSPIP